MVRAFRENVAIIAVTLRSGTHAAHAHAVSGGGVVADSSEHKGTEDPSCRPRGRGEWAGVRPLSLGGWAIKRCPDPPPPHAVQDRRVSPQANVARVTPLTATSAGPELQGPCSS